MGLAGCRRGRVLTYEEYGRIEHDTPYVLRFAASGGALVFFGSAHVFDPADPQVGQIMALWAESGPTLAFNEGGDPPTEVTVAAAVSQFGESGLVRWLAHRDQVPVASIEPPISQQVTALRAAGYSDEQIKLFFVLRQVPQDRERTGQPMGAARVDEVLRYFLKETGIAGAPGSEAELAGSCARLLPGTVGDWRDVPQAWFDPVPGRAPAFTNAISLRLSEVRDAWVVALLIERVRAGERVFAVMGASHVVVQEPALRAALGRPARVIF